MWLSELVGRLQQRLHEEGDMRVKTKVRGIHFSDYDKNFVVRKQPQYPKTYEECCDVLIPDCVEFNVILNGYNGELLEKLGQLLICRDAYWKIAGDWQPNWKDFSTQKYSISVDKGEIIKSHRVTGSRVLVFPTAEMRDIFYENFKELIENCKELL